MADRVPAWLAAARTGRTNTGQTRPPFAVEPGDGQESVWDYPRPPALVPDGRTVIVGEPDNPIVRTSAAVRVLETASPPTFYLPPADVATERLVRAPGRSHCEWKGEARYWALAESPDRPIGWDYPNPYPEFELLTGHFSFYPDRIACTVDGQAVRAQAGGFYGGWITDEVVGPFKGDPGTGGW